MVVVSSALAAPTLLRTAAFLVARAPVSLVRCASSGPSWARRADEQGIDFIGCFATVREMPQQRLPEIALLGRSNVGKSSALNALSNRRKKLAVTSKTPGRTRTLNLYHVPKTCTITDLPGYGFARVSDEMQADWRKNIKQYLTRREDLQLAVLLVDANVEPQEKDAQLLDFLEECQVKYTVVATKVDKLKANQVEPAMRLLRERLALPDGQPLPFSSIKKIGLRELWLLLQKECS